MSVAEFPAKQSSDFALPKPAPLTLAPFERLMLVDDTAAHPMLFVFEIHLIGQIDQFAFETAWERAISRHALLTALVDRRKLHWIWPANSLSAPLDWAGSEVTLDSSFGKSMDLTREPGVRAWVRQGEESARFFCQFHHACCDGYGALQFFEDLFVLYARQVDPEIASNWELRPLEPERLARRASFGLTPPPLKQQLKDTVFGLGEVWNFLRHRLQRLSVTNADSKNRARASLAEKASVFLGEEQGYEELLLDKPLLLGLRKVAAARGVTVNDLLLKDLFLAIQAWNEQFDPAMAKKHIRIMMPCNLRLPEDETLPAANVISYAFLKRLLSEQGSDERFLQDLQAETRAIRELRLSLYFVGGLATAFGLPGVVKRMLSPKYCMASAYLTNIGDWSRFILPDAARQQGKLVIGNLVLDRLAAIPPLRSNTRLGISVSIYAQQMKLGMKFDPHLFTPEDRQQFKQLLLGKLSESAGVKNSDELVPRQASPD